MKDEFLPIKENSWIFQCDPKKYNITEALIDKKVIYCFHWKVKQYKNDIRKGHFGLIWCSGAKAGIYAITELISDPGLFIESDDEKKYWLDNSDEKNTQYRVKMRLIKYLVDCPIKKEEIKQRESLQNLSILKMPRGTNFFVSDDEWSIIKGMLYIKGLTTIP